MAHPAHTSPATRMKQVGKTIKEKFKLSKVRSKNRSETSTSYAGGFLHAILPIRRKDHHGTTLPPQQTGNLPSKSRASIESTSTFNFESLLARQGEESIGDYLRSLDDSKEDHDAASSDTDSDATAEGTLRTEGDRPKDDEGYSVGHIRRIVGTIVGRLALEVNALNPPAEKAWWCRASDSLGLLLPLMAPSDRDHLAETIIAKSSDQWPEKEQKASGLFALGCASACFSKTTRRRIVDAALSLNHDGTTLAALTGICRTLQLHEPNDAQRLLLTLSELSGRRWKSRIIGELAPRMKYLTDNQQKMLVDQALWTIGDDTLALDGLFEVINELGSLRSEERTRLFNTILDGETTNSKPQLICALWHQAEDLDESQRQRLVSACISGEYGENVDRWHLFAGMTSALGTLSTDQKQSVIDAATSGSESEMASALGCIGQAFAHLTPNQKRRLVDTAVAFEDPGTRLQAIKGVAIGMAHLRRKSRNRLFDAACATVSPMPDHPVGLNAFQVGRTWESLAGQLEFLQPAQREVVVATILDPETRMASSAALQRLATQARFLTRLERERLLSSASARTRPRELGRIFACLVRSSSHLSEPEIDELIGHTMTLDDDSKEEAMSGFCDIAQHLNPGQIERVMDGMASFSSFERRLNAFGNIARSIQKFIVGPEIPSTARALSQAD
jgi:hypothetical protein